MESSIIKNLINNLNNHGDIILEEFWKEIKECGTPIIEDVPKDSKHSLVTFLYRGNVETSNVLIYGSVPGYRYAENVMEKIQGTDVFYKTYKVRNDVKFKYNFSLNYEFDNDYKKIKKNSMIDELNPNKIVFIKDEEDIEGEDMINSFVKLRNVKEEAWTVLNKNYEKGSIATEKFYSEELKDHRRVWLYTPKDYSTNNKPYKVLVLTDGFEYLNYLSAKNVFDNLIAEGQIEPTVCVLIASGEKRFEELTCNEAFSNFIVKELMPWIQGKLNVSKDPKDNIIGGVSLGGLAATYLAFKNPHLFGNVLSQSGSYWFDSETLTKNFKESDKLPIKFYLCAGILEDHPYDDEPIMMEVINNMRDTLIAKGYQVKYENYPSGHDYLGWGETLGTGLISLIGVQNENKY